MQIRRRVLDSWLRDLRVGWGERAALAAGDVAPLLPACRLVDLHGIGNRLACDGHALDDVLAWFHQLARRSRAMRTLLHEGGVATLAAGWADGVLGADFGAQHVAPLEVLRLRLQQQVALAASLGHAPGTHLVLVVVEAAGPGGHTTRVLHHARSVFGAGESIAVAPNGKLLILARRTQELRAHTLSLTDALRRDEQLLGTTIRVWVEPLAMSAEHLDSHLLGLAS